MSRPMILCVVTGGSGDLLRAKILCQDLDAEITYHSVDKSKSKLSELIKFRRELYSRHWDLVYLEGTGIVGGLSLIEASKKQQMPYIVSSGDPIAGFFKVTKGELQGRLFASYEKALYRRSKGFIGWTPYLTGLALHLGAKRGATIEGAVDLSTFVEMDVLERQEARRRWNVPLDHLVCGVIGSLEWVERQSYCYGLELIQTLKLVVRQDITVMIIGDGSGRRNLEKMVPDSLRGRVIFTGRVAQSDVPLAINCLDVGFITQTLDELGSFRLTTKLPEYLACGVPVAMSRIPGYYDYASEAGWPLPPFHPSSTDFHAACARWLDSLGKDELMQKASRARCIAQQRFDYKILRGRFTLFVNDILSEIGRY